MRPDLSLSQAKALERALKQRKYLHQERLWLGPGANEHGWMHTQGEGEVEQVGSFRLDLWLDAYDRHLYQLLLSFPDIWPGPALQYWSYGPHLANAPAIQQNWSAQLEAVAPPPYFIRSLAHGQQVVYQTPVLQNEGKAKALGEINLGLTNFCLEANLRYGVDSFPTAELAVAELPFAEQDHDPTVGVRFLL